MNLTEQILIECPRRGIGGAKALRPLSEPMQPMSLRGNSFIRHMKRFTETTKWMDPWFQDLPCKYKAFWQYILDNCDCAGIWKVNFRLASFQIGEQYQAQETLDVFAGRIEDLGNDEWWVTKFCRFQYGPLSKECRPHVPVINLLTSKNLLDRVLIGFQYPTRQGTRKGTGKGEGGTGGNNGEIYTSEFDEFWKSYPRKEAKANAWNAWKKPGRPELSVIMDAVARQKGSEKWTKDGGRYIPMPATWLNGHCWDDELKKPQALKLF